jgi:alpha-mannosidase
MIGNAHIDPVWLWRWQEGFQEVKATFRSALDRMNEYPDFKFTSSSSIFYEWVEHSDPAMFEEIRARVAEGRWEIAGGWVIEPDCNIPSGESFIRQGLYGQRYFKQKFGRTAKTGYNVDSFGHNGNLPQILKKSGLENYVFMRPSPNEKGLPGRIFRWRSNDGSEVLTYRIPYEYCTWGKDLESYLNRLKTEMQEDVRELMFFYGVGNHGGGPTKENIESIQSLDAREDNPQLVLSTTEEFFDSIRKDGREYPVVQDDLQHHASGCYSVHSGIKHWNRKSENMLVTAEKFSSIAKILKQQPYPDNFERAWKRVLFNQFHDIQAGTSLVSAYEDARNMHGEAVSIAEENLNYAVQAISWSIDIEQDETMRPIVVFNPHSWAGRMVCETEVRGISNGRYYLTDEQGNPVPSQTIQSESVTGQRRLLFVADLPSLGYRTYKLYLNQEAAEGRNRKGFADNVQNNVLGGIQECVPERIPENVLENGRYRLVINPDTGYIKSFYDKKQDIEIFKREGARLAVIDDKSDTWSHNVFKFDKEIGCMKPVYIRKVEEGPVRCGVRVRYQYNDSYVTQDFRMYNSLDHVEVKMNVDWREPLTMLKLKFPVSLNFCKPTYEIPYGYIEKNINGEEEPGQTWIDFSGESRDKRVMYGLAIANDAKYSYAFDVDEMAVTILKNSPYAHHEPAKLDPEQEYVYVDQGIQSFTYAMLPHEGSWKDSSIIQTAQEINQRPVIITETYHKGNLPQIDSFISVDKKQVIISAVKEAEDKDGIVIRAYETMKQPVDVEINLAFMGRKINLHFDPCEIKTIKIPYLCQGDGVVDTRHEGCQGDGVVDTRDARHEIRDMCNKNEASGAFFETNMLEW